MAIGVKGLLSGALGKLRGEDSEGTLLRGAGGLFLLNMLGLCLSFVSNIVLVRTMTNESYGTYALVLSYLQIFILFAVVGLDTAVVRYIPTYLPKTDLGRLRGILQYGLSHIVISSSLIAVLTGGVVWLLRERLGAETTATFLVALLLLPLSSVTNLREASLRAFKRVIRAAIPEMMLRPTVLMLLAIGVFLVSNKQLTAPTAMGLTVAAVGVSFLLGTFWLTRALPAGMRDASPIFERRTWLKVAFSFAFITGMHIVLKRTDVFMIGLFLPREEVGFYSMAARFAELGMFGLAAVNAIAAPMISELYDEGKHEELQRVVGLAGKGIAAVTAVITVGLVILGPFLLSIADETFRVAYVPLLILLAGQVINALTGTSGFIMAMTGHQNEAAVMVGVTAVINIALNLVFIPLWGMVGAALATAITIGGYNLAIVIYVIVKLKLNPTAFRRFW